MCIRDRYKYIAKAMGVEGVENMSQEEYRKAAVDAVKKLSADVGIPADLKAIVKEEDLDFLSESAYACLLYTSYLWSDGDCLHGLLRTDLMGGNRI